MNKLKSLNILLILTSLIGFLEWGSGNSSFLFQVEYELIKNIFINPLSSLHPFTIIPVLGQLILIITLFQKKSSKILTYIGISCLGLLLLFMFLIGIFSLNIKIIGCSMPFIISAIAAMLHFRAAKKELMKNKER